MYKGSKLEIVLECLRNRKKASMAVLDNEEEVVGCYGRTKPGQDLGE